MLPRYALTATLVALALQASCVRAAEGAKDQTLIVEATDAGASNNTTADYSVPVTQAATKMTLQARDIPQSISIISKQRMQDQQLQSVGDVLNHTTGVMENTSDLDRKTYYSRGFLIDNYMVDGIPTVFEPRWNLGDAQSDSALYERIEVVRGATGLMTGPGNPSAAVDLIRKHADSREFTGNLSTTWGSWHKQRYVADLTTPLNQEGSVRGRLVAGWQDRNSYVERYGADKTFVYGVVDADLTAATTLSVGYEFQRTNADSPTWSGLPRWHSDGNQTDFRRGFNTAPDWSFVNKESRKTFLTLKQNLAENWQLTLNGTHNETVLNSRQLYIDGFFDQTTGLGVSPYVGSNVVGGTGYNTGKRKVDALDAYLNGQYALAGRQHELMMGTSYTRQQNTYYGTFGNISSTMLGDFNQFNGQFPETDWGPRGLSQEDSIHQQSAYVATRLSLADPLHMILGARYTRWRAHTLNQQVEKNNITPYGGLVYDINDNWSAYTSYTSVFQPQTYRAEDGSYLAPAIGKNYEAGIKSDWYNSRLTTSLTVFRIELDNVAQRSGRLVTGTKETAYEGKDGTVSRGVEFEINGALSDNWQMTFGGTRYVAEDGNNDAINPDMPRTQFRLFTRYRLPQLQQLTLGGGVNWQTHVWNDVSAPQGAGTWRATQGSYALVDLFGRYQVTKQLALQANLNNLFDKEYDTSVDRYIVYGEPRNVSLTASYSF